jgi:hypothetical protein
MRRRRFKDLAISMDYTPVNPENFDQSEPSLLFRRREIIMKKAARPESTVVV